MSRRRRARRGPAGGCANVLTAAFLVPVMLLPEPAVAGDPHRYDVHVDAALGRLNVRACTAGAPAALTARDPRASRFLLYARRADTSTPLPATGNRIVLGPEPGCIEYAVDLALAARANRRYGQIGAGNVALSPSQWLWRPAGAREAGIEVRFTLPAGMHVSVPWTRIDDSGDPVYTIPRSPASDDAVSAFGRFDACDVAVPGGRLRAAVLQGKYPGRTGVLLAWLESAALNVALAYGRFPNPDLQVVVIPSARGRDDDGEPVPFGHVIRDGGEAVQFFVNQRRPLPTFLADWTATHEFAHLLIPYVSGDENWISEGLASYYQNVLMARSGAYTPEKAWRKIIEGFGRGEKAVPDLALEDAMPRGSWDGIMKTYWGGAAVFLLADIELRERSGNAESLDTVLERLQRCCLPSPRRWHGRAFFRKLDELSPHALFEGLYEQHRASSTFPAYRPALGRLGLALEDGRVRMPADAPLAGIRDDIMARAAVPEIAALPAGHCGNGHVTAGGSARMATRAGFR